MYQQTYTYVFFSFSGPRWRLIREVKNYLALMMNPTSSRRQRKKRTKRKTPAKPSSSKKLKINPIASPPSKATAKDLFGSDSEDGDDGDDDNKECPDRRSDSKKGNKTIPPLYSYITRRIANGYARQLSETKEGSHYVELKIYNTVEAEKVSPINRWRHSIITVKMKTNEDTEVWQHIKGVVGAARRSFRNCPTSFIPSSHA